MFLENLNFCKYYSIVLTVMEIEFIVITNHMEHFSFPSNDTITFIKIFKALIYLLFLQDS